YSPIYTCFCFFDLKFFSIIHLKFELRLDCRKSTSQAVKLMLSPVLQKISLSVKKGTYMSQSYYKPHKQQCCIVKSGKKWQSHGQYGRSKQRYSKHSFRAKFQ
ncbi:hypothetical protein BpHYR1_045539, partial [Brachionus plicatilis]